MNDIKISIIVPIYNVEQYLNKCIESIVNQTYINLEIILVDDGSTDKCPIICDQWEKKDKRIKVIHKKNEGISAARNAGLDVVSGQYIMFVDSDDWIDLNSCEKAITSIQNNDAEIVLWSYIREFSGNSKPKDLFGCNSKLFNTFETRNVYRRLFGLYESELSNPENLDSIVTVWGKLYKKEILDGIKFVDSKILAVAEDLLFNIYVFARINKIFYINERLYHYRKDNKKSATAIYKSNLFNQWEFLYDCMQSEIDSKNYEVDFQTALNNRIALGIIGLGLTELNNPMGKHIKVRKIKEIISSKRYRNSYKTLQLKYFPLHWKVFFLFAKMNFATGLYILLVIIKKMIGK